MGKTTLRKLHRRLGAIFCFFVFLAAGSGVIHNVMSWTQSPPPRSQPDGALDVSDVRLSPGSLPERLGPDAGRLSLVALRRIDDEPWYQCFIEGQAVPRYFSALDGREDPEADKRFARQIASAFLGGVDVEKTGYLEDFNDEYIVIYRILPVYRFEAGDAEHTRVYVSTMTGTVTRHTDDHRQLDATIFSVFHKFAFIHNKNWRNGILTATTGGIALAALSGLVLLTVTRKRG